MKRVVAIMLLVLTAGFLAYAGVKAPRSIAYQDTCHSTKIALKSRDTVKARRSLGLTVSVTENMSHGLALTLQYRKATSRAWRVSGGQSLMPISPYQLKWKAPALKGRYKLRVKAEYGDEAGAETTYSTVKTVTVN